MQLDLFDSIYICYNKAIKALLNLEAEKAKALLEEWTSRFRLKRDLKLEWSLIEFLEREDIKCSLESDPQKALQYWDDTMELQYRRKPFEDGLLPKIRRSYFKKVSNAIIRDVENGAGVIRPWMLLCCLRAGRNEEVIRLGKIGLKYFPNDSRMMGYIADAYWDLKESVRSKSYYLQALLKDPHGIDVYEVKSRELFRLLTEPLSVLEDIFGEGVTGLECSEVVEWAASVGLLTGFFDVPKFSDYEAIRTLWQYIKSNYVSMTDGVKFAVWMILSEQGMEALSSAGLSIGEARSSMKTLNPGLFKLYMKGKNGDFSILSLNC